MTFPVRGWLQKPGFRTGLRVVAVILVAYAIMLIANVSPPKSETQCPWVFPKIVSCLLGTNLAGGIIGAGCLETADTRSTNSRQPAPIMPPARFVPRRQLTIFGKTHGHCV